MKIILRFMILVVTFVLSFVVYSFYYNIDGLNLDESLSEIFEADVKVHSNSVLQENSYYVKEGITIEYRYEKLHNQFRGSAILEKGLNKKYRIVKHQNVKDESLLNFKINNSGESHYIQFYGDIDDVNNITFYTTANEPLTIDMTQYLPLEEIDINFKSDDIEYYTVATDMYSKTYGFLVAEEPYIFNGQTIFIFMPIGLIVILGFIVFSMFSNETNLLEGLFNRLTRIKSKN